MPPGITADRIESALIIWLCVCVLRSWCAHILFIFGIWFLFSFFQFYFGSASTCFILMRDGGNGAQESSLGWELSHGAPDPSLLEGFRPSADFRPCQIYSVLLSPGSMWFLVIFFWVIHFVFGCVVFWLKSFWLHGTLVLTTNSNSSSSIHSCRAVVSRDIGKGMECEQRAGESRYIFCHLLDHEKLSKKSTKNGQDCFS